MIYNGMSCEALERRHMNLLRQEPHPISDYLTPQKAYDPLRLAYAAGYFDGEGTIYYKCTPSGRYGSRIQITSQDYWSLEVFVEMFGSRVHSVSRTTKSGHRFSRDVFRWYLTGSKIFEPLRAMLPFLLSKRLEAEAVLNSGVVVYPQGKPPSAEQKLLRNVLVEKLSALKSGGRQCGFPLLIK